MLAKRFVSFKRHSFTTLVDVPIHFLQESVRFHLLDLGRQCIILEGILEDLGRKVWSCKILQEMCESWK